MRRHRQRNRSAGSANYSKDLKSFGKCVAMVAGALASEVSRYGVLRGRSSDIAANQICRAVAALAWREKLKGLRRWETRKAHGSMRRLAAESERDGSIRV